MAARTPMPVLSWTRDNYEISTDPSLIALDALNDLFGSVDLSWAKPLPLEVLQAMIQNSLCFVLYQVEIGGAASQASRRLIGFARWISDMVTVAYMTDVYIMPEYRNRGLGVWMVQCVDETFQSMPYLRGMVLIADRGSAAETLYRKHLGMQDLESPGFLMDRKGRGAAL